MSMSSSSIKFLFAAVATAALVACGGGGTSTPEPAAKVATSDTSASIGPANGAAILNAVANTAFTFDAGTLGSTTSTVLTFTDKSATPAFTATSSAGTVSGTTTFGSCIFTVRASSNPAVAVGTTFTYNPCTFTVATAGLSANGVSVLRSVALTLNSIVSQQTTPFNVIVAADGAVFVGGVFLGGAGLVAKTGAN